MPPPPRENRGPVVVVVGGQPYSGKHALASALAEALHAAPPVRFEHTTRHLPASRRYRQLARRIGEALRTQRIVIAEAPLARREHRLEMVDVARSHDARLAYVECTCTAAQAKARLFHQFASAAAAFLELRAARALGERIGYQAITNEVDEAQWLRVDGALGTAELTARVLGWLGLEGASPPPSAVEPGGPGTPPLRAPRVPFVLAIDDDGEWLATLREVLQVLGCRVATAESGVAALTWAASAHPVEDIPELVFLDYALPDRRGLELASWLRSRWPGAQIVMISAHDEPWVCDEAFREGISEFLRKPVSAADLVRVIEQACDPNRRMAPAPSAPSPAV